MEFRDRTLKDVSSNLQGEAQRFFDEAQDRASELIDVSADLIRENQTAAIIGAGLLVGVIGFFLGRASKNE